MEVLKIAKVCTVCLLCYYYLIALFVVGLVRGGLMQRILLPPVQAASRSLSLYTLAANKP